MTATLSRQLPDQGRRLGAPALVAVGVLGTSVLLHLRDPHRSGSWGFCPWLMLTGTYCPGCGGLRAVNDLTDGDLRAALSSNVLVVGAIPLAVLFWARWVADRWRGVTREVTTRQAFAWSGVFSVVVVAFWVARNTPWGAGLAP